MTKSEAIEIISNDKKLIRICRNITGGNLLYKDLYQETLLILLECSEDYFQKIKCIECFFIKIADRNWNSVTSRFYYKYRKKETFEIHEHEYDPEVDDTIKQIERKIKKEYWYDRRLFEIYLQEGSCRAVSRKTGIPFQSVALTISKLKKRIHENITGSK